MASFSQSSFRQILVTRILLVFFPVLLIGEIVALNKARSSLLNIARQNLTESAVIKSEKLRDDITNLKTNLIANSKLKIMQSGSEQELQELLIDLQKKQPDKIDCLQLINFKKGNIIASSCGDQQIASTNLLPNNENINPADTDINTQVILSINEGKTGQKNNENKLQLLFSIPVINRRGNLAYRLLLKTTLYQQSEKYPGSLTGSLIVISEDGKILAHPLTQKIGTSIYNNADGEQIKSLLKNAISGQNNSAILYFQDHQELVVGYTAIYHPLNSQKPGKWIILAATTIQNALWGIEEFKLILIVLTVGLIAASLLASFYLVPYLANPVEELRDYAVNLHSHHAAQPIPRNFKIREFNQLAQALDQMVERLKSWAEELEIAWKEAKSANQLKSEFLATTSHELRNPLNIIINSVRLVHEGLCDSREEELEFLRRADETAVHLLGIINDLLDISKIEAGKLSVVITPLDLRILLLDVINLQSVNVQKKGLQLICEIGDKPLPIKADVMKLKQVLINIISNSTKFTDEGNITITTETTLMDYKPYISVIIKDTGIGIEANQQGKLFKPFVMVDGTTTRKFEGTGLGLAISRNLIELMGGKIYLHSLGLNQGTTVTIKLPLIDIALLTNVQKKDMMKQKIR
ncbi:two-component sensor histidine kinase [Anabaena sp. FACHB-1237]|uniref:sensor histidine kinase n=1 Tax=Anabaena sp. FACHB-1237 TaxID=2692769 RepID=UPI0016802B31|nr:ATP-binding protein [Anabaena sp. FACHB-1237]MBD2137170.1 two-component sensor histidine kinase [Anabaena sp. FACHB-1237]